MARQTRQTKLKDRFKGKSGEGHVFESAATTGADGDWYWVEEIDFHNDSAYSPPLIRDRAIGIVKRACDPARFAPGETPPFSPSSRLRVTVELVSAPEQS